MTSLDDANISHNGTEVASHDAARAERTSILSQPVIFGAYSAVAIIYCALFSWIFFTIGESATLGWVHLIALCAVVANWIAFRNSEHSLYPIHIILITGTAVVAALFATGGWEGTGYLWTFGYLPYATFLPEKKHGVFWICLLLALDALLVLGSFVGLMVVPYSGAQLFNFFACYIVFATCIYFFKDALEKSEAVILKDAEELHVGKEMSRLKSEFVALVSHQLRSPLTLMTWSLDRLEKQSEITHLSEIAQEDIKTIRREARRMNALISDILDMSRLEAGTMVIQPYDIDIVALAKDVLMRMAPVANAKKITIEESCPESLIVRVDPTLMQVIFTNVLSNAFKYTPSGGTVSVGIARTAKHVEIFVSDTGHGIPLDEQPKVFTKLFRGREAAKREPFGTGLGLYIVKSIITSAGGDIRFESEEGKGTCFYVTLPAGGMQVKGGLSTHKETHSK